jgi:hypothetical protein
VESVGFAPIAERQSGKAYTKFFSSKLHYDVVMVQITVFATLEVSITSYFSFTNFVENNIDTETFNQLSDSDIKELILAT